jgi:hypothetical protein
MIQKKDLTIETKKISRYKTDSFFYDGQEIAFYETDDRVYILCVCGDVRIHIENKCSKCGHMDIKSFRNHDLDEAIDLFKLTDKKLWDLEGKEILKWDNNNWFKVEIKDKKTNTWINSIDTVTYDYDSGIQLLLDTINKDRM